MMTNQVGPIPVLSPEILKQCESVAQVALTWGKYFIILAFFAALALIITEMIARLRQPASTRVDALPDKDWLDALKGVLEAVANLPTWVAIFLAGLALLWLGREPAEHCVAPPKSSPAAAQPAKGAAQANSPQQNQTAPETNKTTT